MNDRTPPRVVVASDSFKGSLSSAEVGDAVRLGLLDVARDASVVVVPVADGGEGTVAAVRASGWGAVTVEVHGPTGEPVSATLGVRGPEEPVSATWGVWGPEEWVVTPLGSAAPPLSTAESVAPPPDDTAAPPLSTAESVAPPPDDTAPSPLSTAESRAHTPDAPTSPARMTVVVEMADACGLGRLPAGIPAPLTASSRGLGDALRAALDLGADEVVVGVGGSASTDGGAGMLTALGARLLDRDGHDLPDGGAALADLAHLDLSGLDARLARTRLVLAADVDSPLLGPTGAAAVFAPQKGATAQEVDRLEAALTRWSRAVADALPVTPSDGTGSTTRSTLPQQPGAGAAGGVGFALLAVLGAERRPGVDVVLDLVGLDAALTEADLVVTGEGTLDAQTLAGKAVAGVARRARAHGIPVVAVCGRLALDDTDLAALGLRSAHPLSDLEPDAARSLSDAANLLRRTGRRIAREWLSSAPG